MLHVCKPLLNCNMSPNPIENVSIFLLQLIRENQH